MKKFAYLLLVLMGCSCSHQTEVIKETEKAPVGWALQEETKSSDLPTFKFEKSGDRFVVHAAIVGRVDEGMADGLENLIVQASQAKIEVLLLEINSGGGEVPSGFRISKMIENAPFPVVCVVDYEAQSMAYYILQSCDWRFMTQRSVLMMHNAALDGQVPGSGHKEDWKNEAEQLRALDEALLTHEARRMRLTIEEVRAKISGSTMWIMNWPEALNVGAVDGVVRNPNQVYLGLSTNTGWLMAGEKNLPPLAKLYPQFKPEPQKP